MEFDTNVFLQQESLLDLVDFTVDFYPNTVMLVKKIDSSRFLLVPPQNQLARKNTLWGVEGGKIDSKQLFQSIIDCLLSARGARIIDWVPLQERGFGQANARQHTRQHKTPSKNRLELGTSTCNSTTPSKNRLYACRGMQAHPNAAHHRVHSSSKSKTTAAARVAN